MGLRCQVIVNQFIFDQTINRLFNCQKNQRNIAIIYNNRQLFNPKKNNKKNNCTKFQEITCNYKLVIRRSQKLSKQYFDPIVWLKSFPHQFL